MYGVGRTGHRKITNSGETKEWSHLSIRQWVLLHYYKWYYSLTFTNRDKREMSFRFKFLWKYTYIIRTIANLVRMTLIMCEVSRGTKRWKWKRNTTTKMTMKRRRKPQSSETHRRKLSQAVTAKHFDKPALFKTNKNYQVNIPHYVWIVILKLHRTLTFKWRKYSSPFRKVLPSKMSDKHAFKSLNNKDWYKRKTDECTCLTA